jgi:hypothetical protein
MYVCERCRLQVRPASENGIVYAVVLHGAATSRGIEFVEGEGVFFHATCVSPETTGYRRKPMPDNIDDGDA